MNLNYLVKFNKKKNVIDTLDLAREKYPGSQISLTLFVEDLE